MKNVLLSADVYVFVCSVPDIVADNLLDYCLEFEKWLDSSEGKKYCLEKHNDENLCYLPHDFIDRLNESIFPETPSQFISNLGLIYQIDELPDSCKEYPWFNF